MSHEVTQKTHMTNLEAIKAACTRLGWRMQEGGQVRYYYGKGQACDYTIEMVGEKALSRYNLGMTWNGETFQVVCDNAMNGPAQSHGLGGETPRILGKLEQAYNIALFEQNLAMSSVTVTGYERMANGDIVANLYIA